MDIKRSSHPKLSDKHSWHLIMYRLKLKMVVLYKVRFALDAVYDILKTDSPNAYFFSSSLINLCARDKPHWSN